MTGSVREDSSGNTVMGHTREPLSDGQAPIKPTLSDRTGSTLERSTSPNQGTEGQEVYPGHNDEHQTDPITANNTAQ